MRLDLAQVGLVFLLAAAGCGPPRGAQYIASRDPAVKIPAIKVAARQQDRDAIPVLIKDLASADPAVRFYAIEGLQKITGQTMGYNYYGTDEQRAEAIARWNQWLGENTD
jgi:hypothetical protein